MIKLPKFTSKAFLAPMSGVSDAALRLISKELGAGLVVTEFTSVHAVKAREKDIKKFIEFSKEERPVAIQLFGSDLKKLEQAVKIVEPFFDIIDYNMGCPADHITKTMACSALLQEPELTRNIFRTMVKATKKPITVKIRAGIDKPDKWQEIAKIAEEEGLAMITLHPRTVKQGYSGHSDWNLIKQLKQLVSIPVCGNGDIKTAEDAQRMLKETGCDYVMVGRAAAQNPFIFAEINNLLNKGSYFPAPSRNRMKTFLKYIDYSKRFPNIKPSNIRMHAMNFSKGCIGSKKLRGSLLGVNNVDEIKKIVTEFYESL
jgi:tRNA-dihydrouridine synthase B